MAANLRDADYDCVEIGKEIEQEKNVCPSIQKLITKKEFLRVMSVNT